MGGASLPETKFPQARRCGGRRESSPFSAQFGSKLVKFSQCTTVQFEPIVINYRLRQYKIVIYMHIYGHAR